MTTRLEYSHIVKSGSSIGRWNASIKSKRYFVCIALKIAVFVGFDSVNITGRIWYKPFFGFVLF